MLKILSLMITLVFSKPADIMQSDKVSIEVINQDASVIQTQFSWPFKGPPPVGKSDDLVKKVNKILTDNGVDCPPKREKVSDNIWKCGNGKKIRTSDTKLARLLAKAWD